MQRFWQFLIDPRTLTAIGFIALASFLLLGLRAFEVAAIWAGAIFAGALLIGLLVWWIRRRRAAKASEQLGDMLEAQTAMSNTSLNKNMRAEEVELLRKRMVEAVQKIKTSKLGETSGMAALYELPWYMVIGNPAAGKSTAIANSGLQFPLADKTGKVIHGVGGTRNCDWFFTSDGILLDTAGRYSVHEEDLDEWFGFLGLLKKHRPKAPINGIIIAASIGELIGNRPEFAITLAKNLRQRVQELTERLEVFAPVYLIFTKADLIAGFTDFFQETNRTERDRVWGATLPYAPSGTGEDAAKLFDKHFDELYDGLREMSLASMALSQDEQKATGLLTFPLEFASIKTPLRAFIMTLFEENPFQFKPVFRGFYFTSALQEGASASTSSERVAERFALQLREAEVSTISSKHGFFLHDLFRKVVFADKALVARFASRAKTRVRYTAFIAATLALAVALTAWSWSYVNNKRLTENVQADLDKVVRLQDKRLDLQSRMEALEILQDRIEQLEQYRQDRPLSLSLGLYQGDMLEQKLRAEYFAGIKEVMLKPVAGNLESFLTEVVASGDKLEPAGRTPQAGGGAPSVATVTAAAKDAGGIKAYKDSSPANAEDAYNALKTYLMLSDKSRVESGHLNDQLARFWRGWLESNRAAMPREQMIRSAERLISFFLSQVNDPAWPSVDSKLTLVDQSRDALRRVVKGMPARERVYADVKARASTRFPSMTVARIVGDQDKDLIAGSYAISGTFTRDAWESFIESAFKEAANKELQSEDWVLKTAARDDLTLEGSPEQIQKALVTQYKTEYAKEWSKFVEGVTATELTSFEQAVIAMNKFGDPQNSPISKLVNTVYQQTSWDNPSLINEGMKRAQRGIVDWFKETVLRQSPAGVNLNVNVGGATGQIPMGPVGTEFAGVARLVVTKDKDASLMRSYMEALSKLRSRFNQIKNQGDSGPGAKQLMQQTLEGSGSELSEALKFVDEQMLVGMTDVQRKAIRPILVRPLIQAFTVIVKPTESELNKTWLAQVYDPFQKTLGGKYPFQADSKIEATSAEIGQFFGAEGAISKFVTTSMGPLVVRRGDTLSSKTWADIGINLAPDMVSGFPSWVAPLSAGGVAAASGGTDAQTVFQIQPLPASGLTEYTVEIDGQQLRYRNTQAQWANFVWPNPQGAPGARVVATTFDGRTVEMVNFPGRFGLEKLIGSAQRKRKDNGVFELTWTNGATSVSIDLKIVSSPQASAAPAGAQAGAQQQGQGFRGLRLPAAVTVAAVAPLPSVAATSTSAPVPLVNAPAAGGAK